MMINSKKDWFNKTLQSSVKMKVWQYKLSSYQKCKRQFKQINNYNKVYLKE
jgi:hypothetical protein